MNARRAVAVVVAYNSGEFIDRILRDLLDTPTVERIVVVDNKSSDDSVERVARHVERGRVHLVESSVNLGFGAAVNLAVAEDAQTADFIAVVNPDVGLGPGAIGGLLDQFDDDRVGVVGMQLTRSDGTPVSSARQFPSRSTILRRTAVEVVHEGRTMAVDWLCGAFMLWRAEAFHATGGFSSDYFLYYEDVEICRRAHDLGWRVIIVGSVTGVHDQGHGAVTSPGLLRANRLSRRRYARKWLGLTGLAAARCADGLEGLGRILKRIGLRS